MQLDHNTWFCNNSHFLCVLRESWNSHALWITPMAGHQLLCWHVAWQLTAAPHWHLAEIPAEAGSRLMLTPSLPQVLWGPGSSSVISGSSLGAESGVADHGGWQVPSLPQHLGPLLKAKGVGRGQCEEGDCETYHPWIHTLLCEALSWGFIPTGLIDRTSFRISFNIKATHPKLKQKSLEFGKKDVVDIYHFFLTAEH